LPARNWDIVATDSAWGAESLKLEAHQDFTGIPSRRHIRQQFYHKLRAARALLHASHQLAPGLPCYSVRRLLHSSHPDLL
jgi:hypothetical protein